MTKKQTSTSPSVLVLRILMSLGVVVLFTTLLPGQIQSGAAYTIVNQLSGKALDDTNASTANGTQMQQWACNGQLQQNWVLTAVGGGYYTIVNQLSGKALDDTNASRSNGTIMQQWAPNGQQQQNWMLNGVGGRYYTVVNQLSGKALDDTNASRSNGTLLQQWDRNGQQQQNWMIIPAGSCGFSILIDTNQMNRHEAIGDAPLAADGVWAVVVTSCPGCGIADPITDSSTVWPQALLNLNAASWAMTEEGYNDWSNPPANFSLVSQYLQRVGLSRNTSMVYHECSGCPNDTVLTTQEIDTAAAAIGTGVVVLSRTYTAGDPRADYVRQALADSNSSGVAFEVNPQLVPNLNLIQGIQDTLNVGKKSYLLMPPQAGASYRSYIQSVMQYLSQGTQLASPDLYLVLAIYFRQGNGRGFLESDFGDNSVQNAENWLKSYRSQSFGR
jgi:hypothetical protein